MGSGTKSNMISEYLSGLGIVKIPDMEKALEERFGKEKADEIASVWNRLSDEADHSDNPGKQDELYDYLNSGYELSMLVSCYTDADIIKEFGRWIEENRELFGERILDIGCGTGILSCFIAKLLPDSRIISIDRSQNCINIANKIKNINFN